MKDKELINQLTVLDAKFNQYAESGKVLLKAGELQLLKKLYPELQLRAQGQLPQVFNTGCSSCVEIAFNTFMGYYFKTKPTVQDEPAEGENIND
jgi:hypothetical protein